MKNTAGSAYREVLSLAAHELRSPAAVVAGYLRLLLRNSSGALSETEKRMIDDANRSCARLLTIVHELGDLAALEEPEPFSARSPVQVFALFEEVARAAASADGGAVTYSCAADDRTAVILGDAPRLKQAATSLIAATRRERGSAVLEALGFVDRKDQTARAVLALGGPGMVSIRAEIAAARQAPFHRWSGGTGMSIPIACRIVEAHGGTVWSLPDDPHTACALDLPIVQ